MVNLIEVIFAVNSISSQQRLIDVAKVVTAIEDLKVSSLVISRPTGMAAQSGIPEVSKIMYKAGKTLIVLPSLKDAVELLKPDLILIYFESPDSAYLDSIDLLNIAKLMFVVDGSDFGPTTNELGLGQLVRFRGFKKQLPPAPAIAVFAHKFTSMPLFLSPKESKNI